MNRTRILLISLALLALTVLLSSSGELATGQDSDQQVQEPQKELTVQEIVEKTNRVSYYQGQDGRARVSMTITDAQKRERNRVFTILRWDQPPPEEIEDRKELPPDSYCKDQKFYVYFERPADINKMVFIVWKHVDKDDDRWLYMPALDLVKRIAATDKRTSFVGSDFFYEDVSGRNINADTHELAKTTDTYYVLKNTPKKPEEVEFAYYTMWIHRKTFVPVKIQFFDDKGKEYRTYDAQKVQTIQGYPTVTQARMKDLKTGGETVTQYTDVAYNIGIPEEMFTERYLRRPPREYLRKTKASAP